MPLDAAPAVRRFERLRSAALGVQQPPAMSNSETVLYGGDAPFLPSGITQVNFRIPSIRPGSGGTLQFQTEAGAAISDFQYVYVK